MENESKKVLLPMGTIFKLKGIDKTAIIMRRNVKAKDGEICDYAFCQYPEGMDELGAFVCNNDEIAEVIALGYLESKDENYLKEINTWMKENNVKSDQLGNSKTYPNSSTVLIAGAIIRDRRNDKIAMIAGHGAVASSGELYDYAAYSYPDGVAKGALNHEDIVANFDILSEGYINYECNRYMRSVREVLDKLKEEDNKKIGLFGKR